VSSQPQIFGGAEALAVDLCMTYRAALKLHLRLPRLIKLSIDILTEGSISWSRLSGLWWLTVPTSGTR
jgi:hypothetical protein